MKKLMMVAAVALVGAVFAQGARENAPRPPHPGFHPVDPIVRMVSNPKMAEKLAITPEQREKLDASLKGEKEQTAEMQKKLREAMKKQVSLLEAEKVDEAAVMAAIDEVFALRRDMAKAQTRRVIAVKSILTPEQIAKGREAVRELREKHPRGPRAEGEGGKRGRADRPGHRRGSRDEGKPSAENASAGK